MKLKNVFLAGLKTPEPVGMCAKSYVALYPVIVAMQDPQKGIESHESDCLDGKDRYRLTKIIHSYRIMNSA